MFNLTADLGLDGSGFAAGLNRAKAQTREFKAELASVISSNLQSQFATMFSVGAIATASAKTIQYGSHINDLNAKVDVSREGLQKWDYALKQNGSDVDAAAKFFEKLGVAREKAFAGKSEAIAHFRELGVTMDDLKKKRLEDIGQQIGNAVKNGDIQKLEASLQAVGGKAAGALVPAFKDGLDDLFAQAPVIAEDTVKALDGIGDATDRLAAQFRATLAPAIVYVSGLLGKMLDFVKIVVGGTAAGIGALAGGASFKEAQKAAMDVSNEVIDARIKAEQNAGKPKAKPKAFTDEEVSEKDKTKSASKTSAKPTSDKLDPGSLAKMGGFLAGESRAGDPMLDVARQQLETQRLIEKNTKGKGKVLLDQESEFTARANF